MTRLKFTLSLLLISGANIAYTAGAGYGTGQEIVQYFTSYGFYGFIGLLILISGLIFFDSVVAYDARKFSLQSVREVFIHYCGKLLGTALSVFGFVFLFAMAGLTISGAGSYFNQFFGMNIIAGRAIMAVIVFVTCLFGLRKTINIIGTIGPAIAVFVLTIGISSALIGSMNFTAGSDFMINESQSIQPSDSWIISAILFLSFCTLFRGPYIIGTAIERKEPIKTVILGNIVGIVVYGVLGAILMLGQFANAALIESEDLPNLTLGLSVNPILGAIFGVVLLLAIYTTASPLVWSAAGVVVKEKSKAYPWIIAFVSIVAFITSNLTSFAKLYSIVSSTAGYVGLIFIFAVVIKKILERSKHGSSSEASRRTRR